MIRKLEKNIFDNECIELKDKRLQSDSIDKIINELKAESDQESNKDSNQKRIKIDLSTQDSNSDI